MQSSVAGVVAAMSSLAAGLNKSAKGLENAGEIAGPANRKAATQAYRWPGMENSGIAPTQLGFRMRPWSECDSNSAISGFSPQFRQHRLEIPRRIKQSRRGD